MDPIILSGTCSTSQLPLIQLHSLTTGNQLFSFKHPPSSTTSSASTDGKSKGKQVDHGLRTTMGYVESRNGENGLIVALGGGKEGSSNLNVWGFHKEQPIQRLIPPLRLSTISLSPTSLFLAGGTHDGRILLWDLSTGELLLSVEAHYRTVEVLVWSDDESVLCSGSEDAGVSVWCLATLLQATPMSPATPYTTLTDHTLGITSLCISSGTFPFLRILSGSSDGCVKLWDLSSTPSILLATFSFPSPVTHLAWDKLERFFFAVLPPKEKEGGSKVMRVDLYEREEKGGMSFVGGQGMGEVRNVGQMQMDGDEEDDGRNTYSCDSTITSLHLSSLTPHLILGTSQTTLHILSLPSLLPLRIIPPPLSSTSPGPLTFLSILERPVELGAGVSSGGAGERKIMVKGGMGRQVISNQERESQVGGEIVEVRIGGMRDVRTLLGPSNVFASAGALVGVGRGGAGAGSGSGRNEGDKIKIESLETELEEVKKQLKKAVGINEAMWKKIVEGTLEGGNANGEAMEVVR